MAQKVYLQWTYSKCTPVGNSFFLQVLPTILLLVTSKENGECRTPQYLILGRSPECFANLTKGKACMDYMIPLMTPTMIHEGLGHWLQQLNVRLRLAIHCGGTPSRKAGVLTVKAL